MDIPEKQILRVVIENMSRCSVCHRSFEEGDIEIISREDNAWFMIVQCEDCHARNFVAAQFGNSPDKIEDQFLELASEGFLRDLVEPASFEFHAVETEESEPIQADDVEGMKDFLKGFDGDFRSLFSNPTPEP